MFNHYKTTSMLPYSLRAFQSAPKARVRALWGLNGWESIVGSLMGESIVGSLMGESIVRSLMGESIVGS